MENELLEIMKHRRSIRRYTDEQLSDEVLQQIVDAGLCAPNAGGGQRSMIVAVHNRDEVERIGKLNVACMDRSRLMGSHVSAEQPSIIDDPTIKSGFYGAPTVIAVFAQKNFLYSIPDAFCVAENMVIMATSLSVSSCIIARGEETFSTPEGAEYLRRWNIPDNMVARCFVTLGYCRGDYPASKAVKPNRVLIVD
jgi:nitroreductase